MSANQANFPVSVMARVLGVSKAGFYAWLRRPASSHAQANAALLKRIRTVHATSRETYGAPRVHAELRADGERHGRKRIARLMREAGLVGASRRRHGPITTRRDKEARSAPDLVDRNFTADGPDQLWAELPKVPSAKPMEGQRRVPTSPSCRRPPGSYSLQWFSMPGAARSSAGRWPTIYAPSSLSMPSRWRSVSAVRLVTSFTIAIKGLNIRLWPSAIAARKRAFGHRWARLVTLTTTPCARASSPLSNASCWIAAGLSRKPRRALPASASSRDGTTLSAYIPR